MKKHVKEHYIYHFFQILILTLGFLGFAMLQGEIRLMILLFAIFSYVVLGIIHQAANHTLFPKIVLEYVLMGALSASIILFLLKGGIGV